MAEFNPQIQDTGIPDMTGNSRGTGTDRTFETLFSGLTETASNVAKIKDESTQLDIQDQASKMFEGVNQEFGLDAPEGIQDGVDQIQVLQNALQQGKISEVNYYGRLATLSKQLRSKYPGYEHIVDSTIQSVTGTRPANAYRDAIFQELGRAASEASDSERKKASWIDKNAGDISIAVGDDFFDNPEAYDFDKVQSEVRKYQGAVARIEGEQKQLTLMKSRGELNDKRVAKALDQDFSFTVQTVLNKSTGANSPSYQQKIQDFLAKGGGTPEELNGFITTITQAESELRASLIQRGREQYVNEGLTDFDTLNKSVEAALYPIKAAKEAVLGGNFKLAEKYATINKAITDRDLGELFKDPTIRAGAGLSKINQALGDEYFTRHNTNGEIDNIASEIVGRAMLGEKDAYKNLVNSGDQKVSRKAVNDGVSVLANPKITPPDMDNMVDQLFGPDAFDFMGPNVKAEDREQVFLKFLAPNVTRNIFEKGSPEAQKKYVDWAVEKFKSIPAFAAAAGDINTSNNDGNGIEVHLDEKTNRLFLTAPSGQADPQQQTGGRLKVYSRAVNAFNKAVSVMNPILDSAGVDKKAVMGQILQDLAIQVDGKNPEPDVGSNTSFWGSVYDALMKPIGEVNEESFEKGGPSVGPSSIIPETPELLNQIGSDLMTPVSRNGEVTEIPETEAPDAGEIDFIFQKPEQTRLTESTTKAASSPLTGSWEEFRDAKTPLELASHFDGLNEKRDKDVISSFIKKAAGINIDPAKTAWCAAFVNAVLGAKGMEGTGKLNARSFLDWGQPIRKPTKGDVVILERNGSSWQGHVGFLVSEDKDTVTLLGGNQGNSVSQRTYPKSRVLGYRRP